MRALSISPKFWLVAAAALALTSCATAAYVVPEPAKSERGFAVGYLALAPQGSVFLAPPPADGTAVQAAELDLVRRLRNPRDEVRWAQAVADDKIDALAAFAAPFGRQLRPDEAVSTLRILARVTTDIANSYDKAKEDFGRNRPFVTDPSIAICVTNEAGRARLAASKAYPSGHSAFGWAWALLFAEALPERADAIFARGRSYGESRIVCGVHYPSDVEAGRLMGAAVVARLRADPAFARDFEVMRRELRAAVLP